MVNCAVVRIEGRILALRPLWSSSIINNDWIIGGGRTNSTDSYRRVATYFPNLRTVIILDAFLAPNWSTTAFIEIIVGPLGSTLSKITEIFGRIIANKLPKIVENNWKDRKNVKMCVQNRKLGN